MASRIITVEITRSNLQDFNTPSISSITDVEYLSSYNWIEKPTPTIVVPGCPPLWSPPRGPQRLEKDTGLIYIAQNAARHPESPLEPLFRALYIAYPSFDICSIDVVTDRNNIRKLLSFINPTLAKAKPEPFTISIEVAKNTAIFCREETATQVFIRPHEFIGFGHEFEKAYTTNQINGSTGHHRIIKYRFGGLNFIVRYEADGYVGGATAATPTSSSNEPDNHSLSNILASLSLSPSNNADSASAGSRLAVRTEGKVVPLESTLEIKTRVSHRPLSIQEVVPQLWVSQTSKLVRAHHNKGTFRDPKVEDVTAQIKRWEEVNQKDLARLAALIHKILDVVKERCDGKATVKYDGVGAKLIIRNTAGTKMLPSDLYSKWDDENDSELG